MSTNPPPSGETLQSTDPETDQHSTTDNEDVSRPIHTWAESKTVKDKLLWGPRLLGAVTRNVLIPGCRSNRGTETSTQTSDPEASAGNRDTVVTDEKTASSLRRAGKKIRGAPSAGKRKVHSCLRWTDQFFGCGSHYNQAGINGTSALSMTPTSGFISSYLASYNPYKYGIDRQMADEQTRRVANWVHEESGKTKSRTRLLHENPPSLLTIPYMTLTDGNQSYLDTALSMAGSCLGSVAHWIRSAAHDVRREFQYELSRRAPSSWRISALTRTGWEKSGCTGSEMGRFQVGEQLTLDEAASRVPRHIMMSTAAGTDVDGYSTMV